MLPAVTATRYVTPLREGGSLPGLMEADDLGTYVVKWRAAGQGVKVLVAEVVCGELARALSLPVPALVTVDVAPELAVGEPDPEVQELLQRSAGRNLGLDYLPGALDFEAGVATVESEMAGRVLWFDALIGNVDRSWRNPNMLFWHGRLQLIDHGAALTFHHNWPGAAASVARSYDAGQHALVDCRPDVRAADAALGPRVTAGLLADVLAQVPDEWLEGPSPDDAPGEVRARYADQLLARLAARDAWLPPLLAAAASGGSRHRPRVGKNRPSWLGPPPPEGITQR
ncbi:HipA family kinase [Geodermatophilus sp. SYSU D00742]